MRSRLQVYYLNKEPSDDKGKDGFSKPDAAHTNFAGHPDGLTPQ